MILLVSTLAFAIDTYPTGNYNFRGTYGIVNASNVSSASFCFTNGVCLQTDYASKAVMTSCNDGYYSRWNGTHLNCFLDVTGGSGGGGGGWQNTSVQTATDYNVFVNNYLNTTGVIYEQGRSLNSKYNDTARIDGLNTTASITALGFYPASLMDALLALKLSITDFNTHYSSLNTNVSNINTRVTSVNSSLQTEIAIRNNTDYSLASNISTEVSLRQTADNSLTSNLTSEASTRLSVDASLVNNLSSEATIRQTADNSLVTNLSAKLTATGVTCLSGNFSRFNGTHLLCESPSSVSDTNDTARVNSLNASLLIQTARIDYLNSTSVVDTNDSARVNSLNSSLTVQTARVDSVNSTNTVQTARIDSLNSSVVYTEATVSDLYTNVSDLQARPDGTGGWSNSSSATTTGLDVILSGTNLYLTNFISARVSTPSNTMVDAVTTTYLVNTPINEGWHNVLSFGDAYTEEAYKLNGTGSWEPVSFDYRLVDEKTSTSNIVVTSASYGNGSRYVFNNVAWNSARWFVIYNTYTGTSPTVNFVVESSTNNATWTVRHNSTSINLGSSAPLYLYLDSFNGDSYLRLTVLNTDTDSSSIELSEIKLLTSRGADQGLGHDYNYPYSWDENKSVSFSGTTSLGEGSDGIYFYPNATSDYVDVEKTGIAKGINFLLNATFANKVIFGSDLQLSSFTSCTALETDGSGNLVCGSDDTGGGGSGLTASQVTSIVTNQTQLYYFDGTNTNIKTLGKNFTVSGGVGAPSSTLMVQRQNSSTESASFYVDDEGLWISSRQDETGNGTEGRITITFDAGTTNADFRIRNGTNATLFQVTGDGDITATRVFNTEYINMESLTTNNCVLRAYSNGTIYCDTYQPMLCYSFLSGPETWSNMPSAATRFDGNRYMRLLNLSGYNQFRMDMGWNVNGSSGSNMYMRYHSSSGPQTTTNTNLSGTNQSIKFGLSNTIWVNDTNWENLPSAVTSGAEYTFEPWGQGGDGAADPELRNIGMCVR